MKFLILFSVFLITCHALSDEQVADEWKTFLQRTQKTYKSPVEANRRLTIFKENLEDIEKHNKLYEQGKVSYKKGVTQFTDLTKDEFSQYVNKFKLTNRQKGDRVFEANPSYTAPASVDWRQQGVVTYVKNQGQCGSCWSFSATGALEGQSALRGNNLVLSEQNLVDCATSNYYCNGCNGGNMDGAFSYVRDNGISSEDSYPYTAQQGYCSPRQIVLRSSGYVDVAQNEASLQQAVASIGPISVGIDATNELQNYAGGVLYDSTCSNQINHGVLAVGYGNQDGYDYWLIKNSWGDYWGEQGYFKLIRNYEACGITTMASYPTL